MPTTPISVSVNMAGGNTATAVNLYTVPAGKTAIVKSMFAQSASGTTGSTSISKSISGQSYPIVNNQYNYYQGPTGSTLINTTNLLQAPLTLGAGEILQASTGDAGVYVIPSVSTAPTTAADGNSVTVKQIVYGNSIYMMIGYTSTGAYVATSTDCVTWTQRTAASSLASQFTALAYTNGIWVASKISTSSAVYYSTDNGVSWTTASGMAGITPGSIYGANSQFVVIATNNRLWYSTNGNTWTESTSFYTLHSGNSIYNGGWSGSYWIFGSRYGNLATTNFTTWVGYNSISYGQNDVSAFASIDYSPAYGKYYATRQSTSNPNIFRSTEGLTWDNLASLTTFGPQKIACAGSNTVLIACDVGSTTARAVSTNGTTWASGTDSRSYAGQVFGLANGYYLTYANGTSDECYVSTNPTSSTGTLFSGGNDFAVAAAAADPISGKWCSVGQRSSSSEWRIQGGTSATNINAVVYPSITTDSTNGTPVSVCWSAADGYFYMLTDTGQIRRSATYNGTWTLQGYTGMSGGYSAAYGMVIRAVGTTLYAIQGNLASSVYVGSTLNGGAGWSAINLATNFPGYYQPTVQYRSGQYKEGNGATNGSYFLMMNRYGTVTGFNPAGVASNIITPPMGCNGFQSDVNGYTFAYAGYNPNQETFGVWWSTNPMTTYGSYFKTDSARLGVISGVSNKVTYVSGSYYLNSIDNTGNVYSSSNLSSWTSKTSGITLCGVPTFYGGGGYANDGTNYVAWRTSGLTNEVTRTPSPQNYIYAQTMTVSLVEIS